MAIETRKPSRLAKALLETADDMYRAGLLSDAAREKITMRHLGEKAVPAIAPLSPGEIRMMRERAHMSQAVWARHLNLTAGYVSQLERGTKHPTGPALVLLNVIKRKGIEAIL
ncbi:helix-turn-helix domain-containing protein [Labrys okinawensis]|uniref:helix-turn-helix domain-containing protein n=1 Tax=Labrys okinawensis TaxID=346911 RepID=UPI0039BD50D7